MNGKSIVNLTAFWTIAGMLLMTALGADHLSVIQSPAEITVRAGANTQLFCAWVCDCDAERVTIQWWKDGEILKPLQTAEGQVGNGTTVLNLTDVNANDSGVYRCKIEVLIPQLIRTRSDRNGTILTVDDPTDSSAKPALIPLPLLIVAVCGGTLLVFLGSLSVSLWRSAGHGKLDQPTYANTSEGFQDKHKSPHSQIEEEAEEDSDINDAKNKMNTTESQTCAEDLGKPFQVSRDDIVDARKKLKVKRPYFFRGAEKSNVGGNGHFKRKRSHDLKKQSRPQNSPHVDPTQVKQHSTSQRRSRRARGKQLTAQELYENV